MAWIFTEKTRFYLHENETLLEGLIRTGHNVKYECKSGYCGSCRTKIIYSVGEVTHTMPPLALLEENEVLACCCRVSGTAHIAEAQLKNKNSKTGETTETDQKSIVMIFEP